MRTAIWLWCLLAFAPGAGAETALGELSALAGAPVPAPAASGRVLGPAYVKNELPLRLGRNPLIVVHASREFDSEGAAADGVDAAVLAWKARNDSVVYLISRQDAQGYLEWYTKDRRPDYEIFSEGGEHNLPLYEDSVTIVGGFFGSFDGHRGCQTLATRDAIRMHFETSGNPFTVYLPVRALYFYDDDSVTREKLLKLDVGKASPEELREMFGRFAEKFFLTDNFSEVPAFGHPYFGGSEREDKAYREGESVDVDGYSFELFFNEKPVARFGHGTRKVSLKLVN